MHGPFSHLSLFGPGKGHGPHESITTGHPATRLPLTKHDRIKDDATVYFQSDRSTTALIEVIQLNQGGQRLFPDVLADFFGDHK